MDLKTFIERAEKCVGSQKELAERIGQSPSALRSAKAGLIGLPNYACVMIADLIGEDKITVIAASELVTEKKEKRRQIWQSVIAHAPLLLLVICIISSNDTNSDEINAFNQSLQTTSQRHLGLHQPALGNPHLAKETS